MLKQRNLVIRPDNQELAELEMKKLEHFGWVRVVDTPCPDGSVMVSYVRDDEEKRQQAENEYKYRCAKLASEFAESANERLTELQGSERAKKKSVAPAIIFAILSAIFLAGTILIAIWDGFFRIIFTQTFIFNGGWTFLGCSDVGSVTWRTQSIIFLCAACATFFLFFLALMISSIRKIRERNLDNLDYAQFALAEMTYYEEVKENAQSEASVLFPYN